ncbi:MAG: LTA synthase family protein [Firmicutes bacterium]|nr:LTA synthase family protein [Bacillota bacterium]
MNILKRKFIRKITLLLHSNGIEETRLSKENKLGYIMIVFMSIFLTFTSELLFRGGVEKTLSWMINNPISIIWNYIIVISIISLLASLININISIVISSAVIIFLSFMNSIKISLRNIPLIPKDFSLFNEMASISRLAVNFRMIMFLILGIIIIAVICYTLFKISKVNFSITNRIILFIMAIVTLTSTSFTDRMGINNQTASLEDMGFVQFFYSKLQKQSDFNDIDFWDNGEFFLIDDNYKRAEEKPNIIIIMNETFWDPTLMDNLKLDVNVTETVDKLRRKGIYGYFKTPAFGGGTSNVEFELLTGNSTSYYDPGYMLYSNEVKEPSLSLASILGNQGYKTKAIHPYKSWYWNRREVYKLLGFDEFLSEEYLVNPDYKGFFISDEYVTDTIIQEIESTDDPLFLFAVTMQNHGPYNDDRYEDYGLDVDVKNNLDNESMQILRTYSQGIYDADKALGKLVDYIDKQKKPTMVLFFGDHLPILGMDLKVYNELDFMNANSVNNGRMDLYSVPFILYSNYKSVSEDMGTLNTSFMAPYLLRYAGLEMPNYFKQLYGLSQEISVISPIYAVNKNNEFINQGNEEFEKYNRIYKSLQFKNMYNNNGEGEDEQWIIRDNNSYNKELNNIVIKGGKFDGNKFTISGKNLYPNSKLYINDKLYEYTFIDKTSISLSNVNIDNKSTIQMKLLDSEDNLICESNKFIYSSDRE